MKLREKSTTIYAHLWDGDTEKLIEFVEIHGWKTTWVNNQLHIYGAQDPYTRMIIYDKKKAIINFYNTAGQKIMSFNADEIKGYYILFLGHDKMLPFRPDNWDYIQTWYDVIN